ncbi:MAG: phospholipid carrier-dependent glycosyltransferase [Gammaproteobacteria bacterium]|nr:phospholipid carrier-dependent glycosyltransferase [Gammaproteobacteria bacterium]
MPVSQRLLVVVLMGVVWFALLGYRDLTGPDEGRYAEIPREMVASGDWVTPRLNDLKYFEKPALQYWTTAASFTLFGESNGSARLWVALVSFLGAIWVMFVGTRLWGEMAGFYAFLVLISSLLYVGLGHIITLDMTVGVFLAGGTGSLLLAQSDRTNLPRLRNWMLFGWSMLALATLTKGLIGVVLPGGAIVFYSLWQRDWAIWRHLHLGKGLLLFLGITAPWFIAVSIANPEFPEFFFIHEHFDRYTSTVHKRDQATWYFLPILLVGMMPWISKGVLAFVKPGFPWLPSQSNHFDPVRFLWVYVVFMLVFFSLGSSMLAGYILPMFPAIALLVGRQMGEKPKPGLDAWHLLSVGTVMLLAVPFVELAATERTPIEALERFRPWLLGASLSLLGGFLTVRWLRQKPSLATTAVSLSALLAFQMLIWGYQALGESRSSRVLVDGIRPFTDAGASVYSVGTFPRSLPFYLKQPVNLALTRSELALGIEQEPDKWIPDWKTFRTRWTEEEQAVAVFKRGDFASYDTTGLSMRIVYEDSRQLAVVKP